MQLQTLRFREARPVHDKTRNFDETLCRHLKKHWHRPSHDLYARRPLAPQFASQGFGNMRQSRSVRNVLKDLGDWELGGHRVIQRAHVACNLQKKTAKVQAE